jgi:hypothetical protein
MCSAIAVLVAAGSAAAVTLLRSPVTNSSLVSCYSGDSLHSKTIVVEAYAKNPLSSCGSILNWTRGKSGGGAKGFLCVLPNGSLGGFPVTKTAHDCSDLGLSSFDGKLKFPEVLRFEDSAHRYFESNSCPTPKDAKKKMLELIGEYGLKGWRVVSYGARSRGTCATLAVQPKARIVDVVGIES